MNAPDPVYNRPLSPEPLTKNGRRVGISITTLNNEGALETGSSARRPERATIHAWVLEAIKLTTLTTVDLQMAQIATAATNKFADITR